MCTTKDSPLVDREQMQQKSKRRFSLAGAHVGGLDLAGKDTSPLIPIGEESTESFHRPPEVSLMSKQTRINAKDQN